MGFAYVLDPMTCGGLNMYGDDKNDTIQQLLTYSDKKKWF